MPFTDAEKVKIRHHLGYLNVGYAQTFVLGNPQAVETQFIIEGAMDLVLDAALPEARRQLGILDRIECQMVGDHELLAVNKIGEIEVRKEEQDQLRKEYRYWRAALANILGIYPNPFDRRYGMGNDVGPAVNIPVQH